MTCQMYTCFLEDSGEESPSTLPFSPDLSSVTATKRWLFFSPEIIIVTTVKYI